jgi:ribonuclease P protein component
MLPRRHRLTRPDDYRAVLRGGPGRQRRRRAGSDLLVVHVSLPASSSGQTPSPTRRPPRVGFVVSKAVGGSVVRHRVARRLRALVATRLDRLPDGADLVVRAQPPAAGATSAELGAALDQMLARTLSPEAGAP